MLTFFSGETNTEIETLTYLAKLNILLINTCKCVAVAAEM